MEQDTGEARLASKSTWFIGFIIAFGLSFVALMIIFSVSSSSVGKLNEKAETYLLTQRFMSSPYCFDRTANYVERVSLAIPIQGFTEKSLNECYSVSEKSNKRAFQLTFSEGDTEPLQTNNWQTNKGIMRRDVQSSLFIAEKKYVGKLSIAIQNE